jgi:hypothetical protein
LFGKSKGRVNQIETDHETMIYKEETFNLFIDDEEEFEDYGSKEEEISEDEDSDEEDESEHKDFDDEMTD